MTPAELARDMVKSFNREAAAVGLTPTTTVDGLNAYQLITAASIVVKEGEYSFNMPKVARVIFNRLARGGPLAHGLHHPLSLRTRWRDRDARHAQDQLSRTTRTYTRGSRRRPSAPCPRWLCELSCTLRPGTWMYFETVTKSGHLQFSTTFAEQLQAEKLAESRGLG